MKKFCKYFISLILAIGLAFSIAGCNLLNLNDRTGSSDISSNTEESGATAEYEGNKSNQTVYNGVTYLEEDFDYAALYEENYKAVVTVSITGTVSKGLFGGTATDTEIGSGFIISDAGYILTSASLLSDFTKIKSAEGILFDGSAYSLSVDNINIGINCDIALMKFSETVSYENEYNQTVTGMPDVVSFGDSDGLEYGDYCAYIATISDDEDYFVSLAEGIISKPKNTDSDFTYYIDGRPQYQNLITADYLIQTSITSNEGNEGGALFDAQGNVVGVITTEAENTSTFIGNYGYGMSFCVPSTTVYEFIEACSKNYSDLSVDFTENKKDSKNYISNSLNLQYQTGSSVQIFTKTTNTVIADTSSLVKLNYQGNIDKDSSTAKYIADNYLNFTVNVLTADSKGAHCSSGSGFIVSDDGYVLTNLHVINSAVDDNSDNANEKVALYPTVYCTFENGTYNGKKIAFEMEIVAYDKIQDIAILKFKNEFSHFDANGNLQSGFEKVCKFADYSDLRAGERVVAIGNALGYGTSVTDGVVTLTEMSSYKSTYGHAFIQTDCPINSGNSGGALFNAGGLVVGINSMGLPSYENISWAIPSDSVTEFISLVKNLQSSSSVFIVNDTLAVSVSYQ